MSQQPRSRGAGRTSIDASVDRKRPRFWFDPRFAIGLILVAVSVAGVVGIVAATDSSITIMAAGSDFSPGDRVTAADLVGTSVRIADAEKRYLLATDIPREGVVLTRSVAAGELVPAAAAGSASGLQLTSIVLSLTSRLPESVDAGSRLDVWSARQGEAGRFEAPTVIVPSAIVVRLVTDAGLMVNNVGSSVEVLIPRSSIARVLEGVANGSAISAVPVDLPMEH